MSKKATETNEKQQEQQEIIADGTAPSIPDYVDDLLKSGRTVLIAGTREGLDQMLDEIPADVHYGVGAVGHNPETGAFTLRVDIFKN